MVGNTDGQVAVPWRYGGSTPTPVAIRGEKKGMQREGKRENKRRARTVEGHSITEPSRKDLQDKGGKQD